MNKLTHFDDSGEARMVDVSGKGATKRTARAHAFVKMNAEVLASLPSNPKGDPLAVARHRNEPLSEVDVIAPSKLGKGG